jgi:hypothetical protein
MATEFQVLVVVCENCLGSIRRTRRKLLFVRVTSVCSVIARHSQQLFEWAETFRGDAGKNEASSRVYFRGVSKPLSIRIQCEQCALALTRWSRNEDDRRLANRGAFLST